MEHLVWRKNNERCERTERHTLTQAPAIQAQAIQAQAIQAQGPAIQAPAPSPAPLAQVIPDHGFRQVSNKREEANAKINDRHLIGQATQNPFMLSNNYVNDIEVQMNFLTPQRSS